VKDHACLMPFDSAVLFLNRRQGMDPAPPFKLLFKPEWRRFDEGTAPVSSTQ